MQTAPRGGTGSAAGGCFCPVSYTHLDVYKRQVHDGCFEVPEGPGLGVNLDLEMLRKHPYEKAQPVRLNMLGA